MVLGGLLGVALCASGCSNVGSSNGTNSRGGKSDYTPAGMVPSTGHPQPTHK